jgi:hypothetical protein
MELVLIFARALIFRGRMIDAIVDEKTDVVLTLVFIFAAFSPHHHPRPPPPAAHLLVTFPSIRQDFQV